MLSYLIAPIKWLWLKLAVFYLDIIISSIIEENAGVVCDSLPLQGRKDHQHVGQAEEPAGDQKESEDMDQ